MKKKNVCYLNPRVSILPRETWSKPGPPHRGTSGLNNSLTSGKFLFSTLSYNDRSFQRGQMENLGVVLHQLREERTQTQSQLDRLDQAISVLEGLGEAVSARGTRSGRRTMSADARRRIAEAQRRRWAKVKGSSAKPRIRVLSAAARRRIAAAQKVRWAKFRATKKTR